MRPHILVLAALLCTVTACSSTPTIPPPNASSTPIIPTGAPIATPTAAGQPPILRDWIYRVGQDIQPGTYETTAGDQPCYWARLRSFGQANSILAGDNLEPFEHAVVVVEPSDKGFKVANGCTWTPVLGK